MTYMTKIYKGLGLLLLRCVMRSHLARTNSEFITSTVRDLIDGAFWVKTHPLTPSLKIRDVG